MFGKFSEQLKKTSKPVNSLFAMNAKVLEDLSQHQTELFTGLLSDSVKYMESVTVQPDLKGVFAANSEYAEAVRDRITSVSKENYSTLNEAREQVTDLVKSAFEDSTTEAQKATTAAVEKASKSAEKAQAAVKSTSKAVVKKTTASTKETAEAAKDAVQTSVETASQAGTEAPSTAPAVASPKAAAKVSDTGTAKKTPRTRRTTSSATKKAATKSSS